MVVKIDTLAQRLELRTKRQSKKNPYTQEVLLFNKLPRDRHGEGLGLWLPDPCCPAIDVGGGAVVLSSISHGAGVGAERLSGPLWAPERLHEGVTGPSSVFPAVGSHCEGSGLCTRRCHAGFLGEGTTSPSTAPASSTEAEIGAVSADASSLDRDAASPRVDGTMLPEGPIEAAVDPGPTSS